MTGTEQIETEAQPTAITASAASDREREQAREREEEYRRQRLERRLGAPARPALTSPFQK